MSEGPRTALCGQVCGIPREYHRNEEHPFRAAEARADVDGLVAAIHDASETLQHLFPVIAALRTWRDTNGRKPRALQQAEQAVLDALGDFEEFALLSAGDKAEAPHVHEWRLHALGVPTCECGDKVEAPE